MSLKIPFLLVLMLLPMAAAADDSIVGTWLTADGEGLVEIRFEGEVPKGFIKGAADGVERGRRDDQNPDPALRDRPLKGLQIISNLSRADDSRWKGNIYDPNTGKTYKCTISMDGENILKLRGYVGVPMLGRTETWTRHAD